MSTILRADEAAVATLTVSRPANLNALDAATLADLDARLAELERDPAIRAVILTGDGPRAFVAGADIEAMAPMGATEARAFATAGHRVMLRLQRLPKPVIAAVNGFALGGGLELALACDLAWASESAKLGFPEVTLGVIPGFGGTQLAARVAGPARARELVYSGRLLTAAEALEWGLVNRVLPTAELLPAVKELAARIAANAPLAVAAAKEAISAALDVVLEDGLRLEAAHFGALFATADQKAGMEAFLAKAKPSFEGR
ncbi:MAG TPA: enoyl-CoA hydratase-related protein [Anaeromyxobacteraceae bacterium]|nr:enoyl-CoA hydratase-related protein [Anaeromyxobacteraceae bacterium]